MQGLQLSPDGTRLVYLLTRASDGDQLLYLLPLAGITLGRRRPRAAGDCPVFMWRFLDGQRLLALAEQGCRPGTWTTSWSASTWRPAGGVDRPLLPVEPFSLDVDGSGRHVLIAVAGKSNDQRPATVYLFHDGRPSGCRSPGDCWQADW